MSDEAANTILHIAPYVVFLALFSMRVAQGRFDRTSLGLHAPKSARATTIWVLGFLFFAGIVEVGLSRFGLTEIEPWQFNYPWWLIRAAAIVVLAPICEEILFRGMLLNFLERRIGNIHFAIVVQALAFVAVHSFAYEATTEAGIGMGQTFLDACLFAYARRHTMSLMASILMHASGNLIAVMELMLA